MEDGDRDLRRYRRVLIGALIVGAILLVDSELSPYALVTQVPALVKLPSIIAGLAVGTWLATLIYRVGQLRGKEMGLRATFGVGLLPLLIAPVGSYVGRRGFEAAAFAGDVGQHAGSIEAAIADIGTKQLLGPKLRLEIEPGLRDFWLPVDYRPDNTAIGLFCLEMPTERGRYGAIRTTVPNGLESLRLDQFKPCSPRVLEKNPALAERVARIAARNQESN